jgi:DNA-binding NtrC family response regulator
MRRQIRQNALMRTVLIIDDNPAIGQALSLLLSLRDIRPLTAVSPDEGLATLARERVDVVIADMNFSVDTTSGEEGAALFRAIRARHPDLPVILLTAWTHLETAVELVKAGAADYLAKPWDDAKLLATVENLLELSENARAAETARVSRRKRREALERDFDLCGIVFASDEMLRTLELACRVARADVPVLITGPNGAGKERIAQIVHANSAVRGKPLVAVNCGALPGELIEAELFGAEDRQPAGGRADEAAARAGNRPVRAPRFHAHAQGQGARDQRDQRRSSGADPRWQVPRRPLLPPQHDPDRAAAAGGTTRRHPAARRTFPGRRGTFGFRARCAGRLSVAG